MSDTADSTRERLLDVAERLFAERGFRATSIRDITTAADCNVAAVNYHFGGKDKLYLEVYRRRMSATTGRRLAALEQALAGAGEPPSLELVLSTFTSAFLGPLLQPGGDQLFIELMAQEMRDPHLPMQVHSEELVEPVMGRLSAALQAVCPTLGAVQARLAVTSVMAQLVHVVHLKRRLAEAGAAEPPLDLDLATAVDHITRFSCGGVRHLAESGS